MPTEKFKSGGLVPNEDNGVPTVLHCGGSLVSRSVYEKYGAAMILALNGTPNGELLVVPDEELNSMTPSEKMTLLHNAMGTLHETDI